MVLYSSLQEFDALQLQFKTAAANFNFSQLLCVSGKSSVIESFTEYLKANPRKMFK
jgi:predicted SnoaL-like aldol condensation-catalyzing enzyme